MKIKYKLIFFLWVLLLVNSCSPHNPGTFKVQTKELSFNAPVTDNIKDQYHVSPYDILSLSVFKHPEYSLEKFMIDNKGYADIPSAGEIKLSGLTLSDAKKLITGELSKTLKNPEITLLPQKIVGSRFYVLGAVNTPAGYPLVQPLTLWEAIGVAGGLANNYSKYKWYLIRDKKTFIINPNNISFLQKWYIRNKDILVIPSGSEFRVIVMGEVNKPGYQLINSPHPTVWAAIASAGGFTVNAWRTDIGILHWENNKITIRVVDGLHATKGQLKNIFIEPDDIIYVPSSPIGSWNRIISLIQPTISTFVAQPLGVVRDYYWIKSFTK